MSRSAGTDRLPKANGVDGTSVGVGVCLGLGGFRKPPCHGAWGRTVFPKPTVSVAPAYEQIIS